MATAVEMASRVAESELTNRAANMVLDGGPQSTIAVLFLGAGLLILILGYLGYTKLTDYQKQKEADNSRIDELLKQISELSAQLAQVQKDQTDNMLSLAGAERDRFLAALKDYEAARDRALRDLNNSHSRDMAQLERAIEAIEKVLTVLRDAVRDQNSQLQATLIMGALSAPLKGAHHESTRRD